MVHLTILCPGSASSSHVSLRHGTERDQRLGPDAMHVELLPCIGPSGSAWNWRSGDDGRGRGAMAGA
eukprot:354540-Chlamydomonas_euryale.AAC.1